MGRISKMDIETKRVICDLFKWHVNKSRKSAVMIARSFGVHANYVSWAVNSPHRVSSGACEKFQEFMDTGMELDEWIGKKGLKTTQRLSDESQEQNGPTEEDFIREKTKATRELKKGLRLEVEISIKLNGKEIAVWNG